MDGNEQRLTVGDRLIWLAGRHRGVISEITGLTPNKVRFINVTRRPKLRGPWTADAHYVGSCAKRVA